MFPGFVNAYKDKNDIVHLFFYPGLDDDMLPIYRTLDLTGSNCKFELKKYNDNSIEYIFDNKNIRLIHCNLIESKTNKCHVESLKI